MLVKNLPNPGFVAQPGDTLEFPTQAGQVDSTFDPIGRDLDPAGALGGLARGVVNLQGALLRRLRTPKGYLPHHPEYGSRLPEFVGRGLDYDTAFDVRAEVFDCLPLDPRVISVESVSLSVDGDGVLIDSIVMTPLGPLSVVGTVQGI